MDRQSYTGRACLCNQLGHYYILKDMVKNNYEVCLIFQDDVRLKKGFKEELERVIRNMPNDSEIIWIGIHKVAVLSYFEDFPIDGEYERYYIKEEIENNNYVGVLKDDINPASLAYLITRNGAKKYLDYVHKNKFTEVTDGNYNKYLRDKKIMYISNNILATGNSKFKSDIFKYDDNALEREMMEMME